MGELALVGNHSTVPLTQISCNTVFSKSQNARKAGTLSTGNFNDKYDSYALPLLELQYKNLRSTYVFTKHCRWLKKYHADPSQLLNLSSFPSFYLLFWHNCNLLDFLRKYFFENKNSDQLPISFIQFRFSCNQSIRKTFTPCRKLSLKCTNVLISGKAYVLLFIASF